MSQQEYDQHIREIAQGGEIPCPWYFSETMRRLYKSLPEDDGGADVIQDEEAAPMKTTKDTEIKQYQNNQRKKKKLQGGTEIFLLENPDGSSCGLRYRRDDNLAFEVFGMGQIDKYRERVTTTSGLSRVFKNIK